MANEKYIPGDYLIRVRALEKDRFRSDNPPSPTGGFDSYVFGEKGLHIEIYEFHEGFPSENMGHAKPLGYFHIEDAKDLSADALIRRIKEGLLEKLKK